MIKATLVHLGTNMWYDFGNDRPGYYKTWEVGASEKMRFDKKLWIEYLKKMKECGVNAIVLDIGDGIVYDSHPELKIEGSLTKEEIKSEIDRVRGMGFDIIPKLNFSTCHDVWLKDYAKMVSTKAYYKVCADIIEEVCDLFQPKFLHLGMDEEVYENQKQYDYIVIRNNELWWHDLYYLVDCVEKKGVRACMWSDYARHRPEEFARKCPKSVVQCPWYYFDKFYGEMDETHTVRVMPFKFLAEKGFDILAGASNEYFEDNAQLLHEYCKAEIDGDKYLGIIQTTWLSVEEKWRERLFNGAEVMANLK